MIKVIRALASGKKDDKNLYQTVADKTLTKLKKDLILTRLAVKVGEFDKSLEDLLSPEKT